MSTTDILLNSPALNSLKRAQLIQLCKQHGLKATGKNSELISKLQTYAQDNLLRRNAEESMFNLASQATDSGATSDDDPHISHVDGTIASQKAKLRPSELWETIEEETMQEMRELQDEYKGSLRGKSSTLTKSSISSKGSGKTLRMPGEFGGSTTLSKSSSVSSSIKSLANSLRWGSTKSSLAASASISKLPEEYPAVVETKILAEDPAQDGVDTTMADVSIDLHQTIRLVQPSSQLSYPSPPPLRPFQTAFALAPMSPSTKPSLYPPLPRELSYMPVKSSPLAMRMRADPATPNALQDEPFIFGSPQPRHSVSNAQFDRAASSVLEEMNRRLGMSGAAPVTSSLLQGRELGKAEETLASLAAMQSQSSATARPIKTNKRFSNAHQKQFGKMESIADYAARRNIALQGSLQEPLGGIERKRKSSVLGQTPPTVARPTPRNGMPGGFGEDEEDTGELRQTKRVRMSAVPDGDGGSEAYATKVKIAEPEESEARAAEKEREAIRRKLEASRARRRSSRGRPSMGKGPIAPQPKKGLYSRFGFLKGAVGVVKGVWNRGAGNPDTAKPGPNVASSSKLTKAPSTNTIQQKASITSQRKPTITSTLSVPRLPSSSQTRGSIPAFPITASSKSRTSTATNAGEGSTSRSNTVSSLKSQVPRVNSVGFKKLGIDSLNESGSGLRRERGSTLMAPTASSLAKRQSTVRQPSENHDPKNFGYQKPLGPRRLPSVNEKGLAPPLRREPGDITNLERPSSTPLSSPAFKAADTTITTAIQDDESAPGPNAITTTTAKPAIPPRRPRISRTQIVAKLHARRIASDSSRRSSASTRSRRSLGGAKLAAGVSRHSGVGGASAMAAKRRVRASEIARRKSRAPSTVHQAYREDEGMDVV